MQKHIDGTLLNTEEGLATAYLYTIKEIGLPQKTVEEIRHFIGVNYGFGFCGVPEYANSPMDILQKLGIE